MKGSFEIGCGVSMERRSGFFIVRIGLSHSTYGLSIIFLSATDLSVPRLFPLVRIQVIVLTGPMRREDMGSTPSSGIVSAPKMEQRIREYHIWEISVNYLYSNNFP
jgi:hypothetical protein